MSDVKPVAYGLFARVDGEFVLQHPIRFARGDCERDVAMYGPDLVYNIQALYSQETVTALQAEIVALRKDAERLDWLLPVVTGSDSAIANKRTIILAQCLMSGKDGVEAVDAAIAKERS